MGELGAKRAISVLRDHHMHIKKIGVVTDSPMGNVAEHLRSHFVAAEIGIFCGRRRRAESSG
jgi:hypothetical protein